MGSFPGGCGDCYEQGTCQGTVVAVDLADSLCDCVDMCTNTTDCEYMTYTQSNMICTMTRDCQTISTTCADCLTGPKECPPDTGKMPYINDVGREGANSDKRRGDCVNLVLTRGW